MSKNIVMKPLCSVVAVLLWGCALNPDSVAAPSRPNIVVLLADDLGYGDIGCFGNTIIQTPNLDKMAAEGMRFTDCYSSAPMCSPARAGLLTGRAPLRTGVYDWIPEQFKQPDSDVHLRSSEITIATLLKQGGYETAVVGKWHLNNGFGSGNRSDPGDHGFDYWFATECQAEPSHHNPESFNDNGKPVGKMEGYACQIVADVSIDWLKNKRDKQKPFFLLLPFHESHEVIESPPELVAHYKQYENKAQYYACVHNLDLAIGRILTALENQGLASNTLVIFSSDNGPAKNTPRGYFSRSHGSAGPLKGYKRWMFEGGIRVPGIARWPGHIKPESTCTKSVCNVDFLPTFCRLGGVEVPMDRAIDGSDISPLFGGQKLKRDTPLHWHFYAPYNGPNSILREGDWMLTASWSGKNKSRGRFVPEMVRDIKTAELIDLQLYNLRDDIHQDTNLLTQHPERAERMKTTLLALFENTRDEAPEWKRLKPAKKATGK